GNLIVSHRLLSLSAKPGRQANLACSGEILLLPRQISNAQKLLLRTFIHLKRCTKGKQLQLCSRRHCRNSSTSASATWTSVTLTPLPCRISPAGRRQPHASNNNFHILIPLSFSSSQISFPKSSAGMPPQRSASAGARGLLCSLASAAASGEPEPVEDGCSWVEMVGVLRIDPAELGRTTATTATRSAIPTMWKLGCAHSLVVDGAEEVWVPWVRGIGRRCCVASGFGRRAISARFRLFWLEKEEREWERGRVHWEGMVVWGQGNDQQVVIRTEQMLRTFP
ncbi:unnamed protein product, partial [Urochloa humidicola]